MLTLTVDINFIAS